ncbi:MAG: glycoside hydrolase family 88 protein [Treponema sp.]|nr:glycoside hydrolase family 88 protein [Treponema sp.]
MIHRFSNKAEISDTELQQAVAIACAQIDKNRADFTHACQNHSSVHNRYAPCENDQWTCGFWPGELWLAYEMTGSAGYKESASVLVESFLHRIENKIAVDHHDMGFLYSPSCVAAYMLTGNEHAKKAALLAALQLASRFQQKGAFIQAWGEMGAKDNYRYIIDCLLNVPLLYWAAIQDPKHTEYLRHIADSHIKTCLSNSFREDYSTYHTFFMDPETGLPDHGATCQGYKDDSSWARGQAWAVYGIALAYKYVPDKKYITLFENVVSYFLRRLPQDLVPYWDLIFSDGSNEPRDSSSAAIVACGLLEMSKYVPEDTGSVYTGIARQLLKSLYDSYAVKDYAVSNGLLLHGTYSKKSPYNTCTPEGVDECVSWGDYFYMEALVRLSKNWEPYW